MINKVEECRSINYAYWKPKEVSIMEIKVNRKEINKKEKVKELLKRAYDAGGSCNTAPWLSMDAEAGKIISVITGEGEIDNIEIPSKLIQFDVVRNAILIPIEVYKEINKAVEGA